MWPFKTKKQHYVAVAGDEEEQKQSSRPKTSSGRRRKPHRPWWLMGAGVTALALLTAVVFTVGFWRKKTYYSGDNAPGPQQQRPTPPTSPTPPTLPTTADGKARTCATRREWRTLSSTEQQSYITAVRCLKDQDSVLHDNSSSYEDFPWIHSHVGYYTHNSAPFLPWHRYFLQIYHSTLKSKCGYDGELVYWDWTLDSDALEHSPVFDPETGFGGDGEEGGDITIGRTGRCVVDGPFADVVADYYDVKYHPHCLSRGFRDLDGNLGHIDGKDISPSSIEEVLSLESYEDFVALMESRVHDAIPFGVGGDFETFTAPYDPLFFLHHVQLDRLWWMWQQRRPEHAVAYGGHKERHTMKMASVNDIINMQALAEPWTVQQVMATESEDLCYRY